MDKWKPKYRDVPTCRLVRLSRERQRRDLERAAAGDPEFPFFFDEKEADRAVAFFRMLRHVDGEWYGKRFILADWQEFDIIRPLFGWRRVGTKIRRFRSAYIEVARKNGKSPLAAGISAFCFLADHEFGGFSVAAATKEEQARIVWNYARKMIEASPELRKHIKTFKRSLFCSRLGSSFVPLGGDSKTQDGPSIHSGVIDEYHAHKTPDMYNVVASGRGARRQPLLVAITTAGSGQHSPCHKEHDLAVRIIEGVLANEEYFAYIATVDDETKWQEREEWLKANPNFGISVYEKGFESDFLEAQQAIDKQNEFKRKRLNIWTEQVTRWLPIEAINRCGGAIDLASLRGKRCFAGLDLGITRDVSALILAFQVGTFKREETGEELPLVQLVGRYWVPQDSVEQRYQIDGVNYPAWIAQGWISATPGASTRYDMIRRDLNLLAQEYEIAEIAVDRAHAHQLMVELADDGFTVVKHAQTFLAMNYPCRALEELIIERRLRHGDDPVLTWMFSNVAVSRDSQENMKIEKAKSGDRVDGVVAAAMAVGRLLIAPEPVNFIYNSRGLYVA
jgi:phage terminase large subunit-like protein